MNFEAASFKMHIKSIIIDGFKSYAQRTEINGFDPLFNAITGLNGSGKSNILDSICFLLGISNLTQVSLYLKPDTAKMLHDFVFNNLIIYPCVFLITRILTVVDHAFDISLPYISPCFYF